VEQYLNVERSKAQEVPAATVPPTEKQLPAQTLYLAGKQAFDQGDFKAARENFEKIIATFPNSEHADNAQFWVGEIYYREKWYEKAILEYQKVIEKYPKGNKVPASLLKQGFSFFNLGDKANARLILKELVKKYPDSNEGKIARQKLEELQ
jgi:tol-pal system protein YbgF